MTLRTVRALVVVSLSLFAPSAFAADAATEEANEKLLQAGIKRSWIATEIKSKEFAKAHAAADACIAILEGYFPSHPKQKSVVNARFEGEKSPATYDAILAACKKGKADADAAKTASAAESRGEGQKELSRMAEIGYPRGLEALEQAHKDVKAKLWSDASGSYQDVIDKLHPLSQELKRRLGAEPSLATVPINTGKGSMPAQKLAEVVGQMMKEAETEKAGLKGKAEAEEKAAEAAIEKSLTGDRKKIAKAHGMPSWYEGANYVGLKERTKAALTSPTWRYDNSSGCTTTYHFKGAKQVKVTRTAACSE